jgi:oligoribonuclease
MGHLVPTVAVAMTDATLACLESNLIWIDLEMTGLAPDRDRIIEVAVVVTDAQVTMRIEGPVIAVHQSDAVLDTMDELIDRVKASTIDEAQAQQQLLEFLKAYAPQGRSPMCGNSVCQDRRFLANYMPDLEAYFHYRNLDVSTLKELARRWKPEIAASFKKLQPHTALADVHESIDELLHYRQHFITP